MDNKMNGLIDFAIKYHKKGHQIDLATPLSKHSDWLEIVPLAVQAGSRMCALWEGALYFQHVSGIFCAMRVGINSNKNGLM